MCEETGGGERVPPPPMEIPHDPLHGEMLWEIGCMLPEHGFSPAIVMHCPRSAGRGRNAKRGRSGATESRPFRVSTG